MPSKFALLSLLLLTLSPAALLKAQDHLYLENSNRFKRIEILPGDSVLFSLKNDKFKYGARIRGAKKEWVYLREDSLKVTDIDALWVRPQPSKRYWISMLQGSAIMAAILYPVMVLLNRTAVTGYESEDLREMLIVSGGAIGLYFFLKIFRWQKRNLEKGKWRLNIRPRI